MKRRYFAKPIDRGVFLEARMAYLASLREQGDSHEEMMRACNIGDPGQVRLLLMTWDESTAPKADQMNYADARQRLERVIKFDGQGGKESWPGRPLWDARDREAVLALFERIDSLEAGVE